MFPVPHNITDEKMFDSKVKALVWVLLFLLYAGEIRSSTSINGIQKIANLREWGVVGDGKTDFTKIINKAIATCAKQGIKLVINPGIYIINTDDFNSGVQCQSGSVLIFKQGAIFKGRPSTSTSYSIIKVFNCKNVTLINPTIVGEKNEHLGKGGEWGHGLTIHNSNNVTVHNPTISNCWGDGIYIGYDWYQTNFIYNNENIHILNPQISNCRRNGIAICMGKNIVIDNPVIKDIKGTLPEAGIDFEPEYSNPNFSGIQYTAITVNNPSTQNTRYGLLFALDFIKNKDVNITVNNHYDNGSEFGCYFGEKKPGKSNNGIVSINSPVWVNNRQNGLCMIDYSGEASPRVNILSPIVKNWNRAGYKGFSGTAAIAILSDNAQKLGFYVGNITIENGSFQLDKEPTWLQQAYPIGCSWGIAFENVVIKDIKEIKNAATWLATPTRGIIISDINRKLTKKHSGSGDIINIASNHFYKEYQTEENSTGSYRVISAPINIPIKFENKRNATTSIYSDLPVIFGGQLFESPIKLESSSTNSNSEIILNIENKYIRIIKKKGIWKLNGVVIQ